MEQDPKRARGRPEGRRYPAAKHLRMLPADLEDLQVLVARWRCTDSEAIRRAIREAAERERGA